MQPRCLSIQLHITRSESAKLTEANTSGHRRQEQWVVLRRRTVEEPLDLRTRQRLDRFFLCPRGPRQTNAGRRVDVEVSPHDCVPEHLSQRDERVSEVPPFCFAR
jgi:hypothetical protein